MGLTVEGVACRAKVHGRKGSWRTTGTCGLVGYSACGTRCAPLLIVSKL